MSTDARPSRLLAVYRVLAFLVGVLLIVATVSLICKYAFPDGSGIQRFGDSMSPVWVAHGWVYIVYLVVAFVLTQSARWPIPRFLLLLVAGLVPGLIFWVERRVVRELAEAHVPSTPTENGESA